MESQPYGVVKTLSDECGLTSAAFVADIGSGTGLLSRLFLDFGCHVFGVEPNAEMRTAGERLLAHYLLFTSLNGTAEATSLPTASVDFTVAGQAFHWFTPAPAREEFRRILKPGGWAVLVWNNRRENEKGFMEAYEVLLKTYGIDYQQVNHRNVEENPDILQAFFGGEYRIAQFVNLQMFDFQGVKGRLESSSYAPEPGHPNYAPMLVDLGRIFDLYQRDGKVAFEYDTRMFFGRLI